VELLGVGLVVMIREGSVLDISSAGYASDPYASYLKLRQEGAAHWIDSGGPDRWILVTRYDLGRAVLSDDRFSKRLPDRYIAAGAERSMLGSDPPEHTRLRAAVATTFSGRNLAGRRNRIEEISARLLNGVVARLERPDPGYARLRGEYALPFTFGVLAEIIGVPADHQAEFHDWTVRMLSPATGEEAVAAQNDAVASLRDYVRTRVRHDREHPAGQEEDEATVPLLRVLASGHPDDALSETETVTMITLLLAAGYEGTANMILNGVAAFLTHPRQWRLLAGSPELAEAAVREVLRYDCPVQRATLRIATTDVELDGVKFPAGSLVGVSLASANHDETRFDDAGVFDITRPPAAHLAFSHGVHRCLGSALATLEGTVAFGQLARRLPDMRLHPGAGAIEWARTGFLRGPADITIARGGPS
jgi:cytochrome P450